MWQGQQDRCNAHYCYTVPARQEGWHTAAARHYMIHWERPYPVDALCRGKAALDAAQSVLGAPELQGLQLYSFRAAAKRDRLYIRLDKVTPSIPLKVL